MLRQRTGPDSDGLTEPPNVVNGNPLGVGVTRPFVAGLLSLGAIALAGQGMGLYSMLSFNSERSAWDARATYRAELIADVAGRTGELAQIAAEVKEAQEAKLKVTSALAGLRTESELVQSNADAAAKREAEMSASASRIVAQADEAAKDLVERKNEIVRLQFNYRGLLDAVKPLEQSKAELVQTQQQVSDVRQRLSALRNEIDSVSAKRLNAQTTLAELTGRVSKAKEQAESLAVSQSELDQVRLAEQRLRSEMASLSRNHDDLQSNLATKQKEMSEKEDHLQKLNFDTAAITIVLEDARAGVRDLADRSKRGSLDVSQLEKEKLAIRDDVNRLQGRKKAMANDIDKRQQEFAQLSQQIENLQNQNSELVARRDSTFAESADRMVVLAEAINGAVEIMSTSDLGTPAQGDGQ